MNIPRKQCNVLRGLAIVCIVFHNFLHQGFGFTTQNESSFSINRTQDFLESLCNGGFWNALGEIFSFLGWLGVPVFVFLSGYGLVKKYEQSTTPMDVKAFIRHSWLKLFLLMLPGVLFFALYHQLTGIGGLNVNIRYGVYLSLLGNLFGVDTMTPSIYWYFGLTFELYLAYIILNRYRSSFLLAAGIVFPIILQICLLHVGKDGFIHFNLRNIVGWLPVFCSGILVGRYESNFGSDHDNNIRSYYYLIILLVLSGLLIICNTVPHLWVLIHFVSVLFFYCLARLLCKLRSVETAFAFIGLYSSFIFASHPISRLIITEYRTESWDIGIQLLLYILLIVILVPIYRFIVNKITALFQRLNH